MQDLFGPEGDRALARAMHQRPLLAFDFDGTLAPIVAHPEDARPPAAVSGLLQALGGELPLAIVSGRGVADVRARLDFEPHFVVGSHGAEDPQDPQASAARVRQLDSLRQRLRDRAAELAAAGVGVEDKGASVALHYRLSPQREAARELIDRTLIPFDAGWHVFGGKLVVNVVPRHAPDKAAAVHALVARCGAACAVFVGDDINDEPVFESAPPHWLTVRVGCAEGPSQAGFCLDGPQDMQRLLQRMWALRPPRAPA